MANRSRLHINKLEEFKEWLIKDGWEIGEPKGTWEVLRARKPSRKNPLIVYTKMDAKEHLSVMDRDSDVIGAFLRDYKKPKTNADRIRSMIMSNEGLAKFITSGEMCAICPFCQYYGTEQCYIENEGVHKNCDSGIMAWLQSEAEVEDERK